MIGYVMLGTNDLERSMAFYDALLGAMGATRRNTATRYAAWSFGDGKTVLSVSLPVDRETASAGNGSMVALAVRSTDECPSGEYALPKMLGERPCPLKLSGHYRGCLWRSGARAGS